MKFSAVGLQCNFRLPSVISFAGHNYTAANENIIETLSKMKTLSLLKIFRSRKVI